MYLVCSLTDMLLDIAILCIPPVFIRKLNMSRARKIALVCIFSLGILSVTLLSITYFPVLD